MKRAFVALSLVLAGCGGGAPSEVVPADATIYIGVDAEHAESLVPETSRVDVDFEDDVEPWLGDRAAYFAIGPQDIAGLVFDAEDEEAAEAFGRKVTAGGPMRASAVIDGRLVLTSTPELLRAAAAAARSGSLADSTKLDVAGEDGDDPPDVLVAAEDPPIVPRAFEVVNAEEPELGEAPGDGPLTARLWEEPGRKRSEVARLPPPSDTAPSLADVPGAAWLAYAWADVAESAPFNEIEELARLDLERVLPQLGAGMLFVQGHTPTDTGGRLVAEVADEDAVRRALAGSHKGRVRIADGRLIIDAGVATGGVAEDLDDTRAYKDAARRLGGAPTYLMTDETGYRAARDTFEDGRRIVRSVSVEQRG
jgi:hypothetical protein